MDKWLDAYDDGKPWDDRNLRSLAASGVSDLESAGKTLPYLGWFWRDWDGTFSCAEERVWIDAARKWDYPYRQATPEHTEEINRLILEMGKAQLRILTILDSYAMDDGWMTP